MRPHHSAHPRTAPRDDHSGSAAREGARGEPGSSGPALKLETSVTPTMALDALLARSARVSDSYTPQLQPPLQADDPRWVLAVRTQEKLQGAMLAPERRSKLIRLGKVLGLNAFQANLVIAVVQDQARRGLKLDAGAVQTLRFIPMGGPTRPNWRQLIFWAAVIVLGEGLLLVWLIWAAGR